MVFSITSTASRRRSRSGAALVDVLVAAAVASMVLAAVGLLVVFGARSFAAMTNYVILDQHSRNTLDRMSREIRQCNRLLTSSANHLEFEDADGGTLRYEYDPDTRRLLRTKDGVVDSAPLLEGCTFLKFAIYQRNPKQGVYDQYPTAVPDTCKLVQLSWVCARPILGGQNTESVQSAKVVIRKQ